MRILIIDDCSDARMLAKARLAAEGHEILVAQTGTEGLEQACREMPDLVLLDVDMPDISGFEVCRKLKADDKLNMVPVIFVSGSAAISDKVRGLDLGAVDYVTKPYDAFELRARVRAALRTKRLQDILRDRAMIDPLTELANRRAFDENLHQEWARAARYSLRLALIMADIDHFKRVNDEYGHPAGDEVLRQVARRLSANFRDSDMLFRYGGEEFVAILPETSAEGAMGLADRLRAAVCANPIIAANRELTITASFGVSDNVTVKEPSQLVQASDVSLYQAKSDGRNCVRSVTPATPQQTAPAA